ncbi:Ap4A phosphorylase-like protein II [Phaeosphaeria sp. MPI-PUGE-AT-0046c]|nr:Ap4A phosphorylase-like protein II [Phaeosphaeria sp. MPI-PUGE-AT-0046c]
MLLGLSEALPSLVETKFASARACSSLLFSATEVATIRTSTGIPFQLRFCPTLAKKPTPKSDDSAPQRKIDPFENPPQALHIANVPSSDPSHVLVLNKFPIIAAHFILATKSNKKQTHVLEQDDLEATYACLKAWQTEQGSKQKRLFAFFNSGEHSGASQPHRHLQFLPVESMQHGEVTSGWDLLLDIILCSNKKSDRGNDSDLLQHPDLPFVHFARPFDSEPSSSDLLNIYNELYGAAKSAVDTFIASHPGELTLHPDEGGDLPISYNLAMTMSGMAILPRRSEGTMLRSDGAKDIGFVALNGTTLGGTMMVKYQEEWDVLRKRPEALDKILLSIGIPRSSISSHKSHV